jgi:hypothetical protein
MVVSVSHPLIVVDGILIGRRLRMGDFAKFLGRFFARDFVYFLGGCFFLMSVALVAAQGCITTVTTWANAFPSMLLIPAAGLSYVLGYLINFILGFGLNSASDRLLPWSGYDCIRSRIARFVFFLVNHYSLDLLRPYIEKRPTVGTADDVSPATLFFIQALHPTQDYLSRGITLHHVTSVIGSSAIVCSMVFLALGKGFVFCALGVSTLIAGIILCMDSCYRAFQVAYARIVIEKWAERTQKEKTWE